MASAPLIKYTDRDVREDASLTDMALAYLKTYEGEFQFLVDCKMRLAMETSFTPGMIRGILNCMRADPRAPEMPEPLPPEEYTKVVSIKKKQRRAARKPCDIEGYHEAHGGYGSGLEDDTYEYCEGKYPINRTDFQVDATIKVPYMTSRSGKMVHRVKEGWFMWRPNRHGYGWWRSPQLYVRTICTYPRMIDEPLLIPENHLDEVLAWNVGNSAKLHELCERCFPCG